MHLGAGVLSSYVSLLNNETLIKMMRKKDKLSVEAEAIDDLCPPEERACCGANIMMRVNTANKYRWTSSRSIVKERRTK